MNSRELRSVEIYIYIYIYLCVYIYTVRLFKSTASGRSIASGGPICGKTFLCVEALRAGVALSPAALSFENTPFSCKALRPAKVLPERREHVGLHQPLLIARSLHGPTGPHAAGVVMAAIRRESAGSFSNQSMVAFRAKAH